MKKRNIIMVVVISILLLAFFTPRFVLHGVITSAYSDCKSAEYVTEFTPVEGDTITVENDNITIEISNEYGEGENHAPKLASVFETSDEKRSIMLVSKLNEDVMNFYDPEYQADNIILNIVRLLNVDKVFGSFGDAKPDSSYNTLKCVALLDYEDYDFWNLRKSIGYIILAENKQTLFRDGSVYIYENEAIQALILQVGNGFTVFAFDVNDLNKEQGMTIKTTDINEVFTMLSTMEFK